LSKESFDAVAKVMTQDMANRQKAIADGLNAQNQKIKDLVKVDQQTANNTIMTSPDGTNQVNISDLTPEQIKEAKNAGWK